MCVLECFLIRNFLVGDPPPIFFVEKICLLVTNKTRVPKFPFPALLVRPGKWKVIRKKAFLFLFDIYLEKYCCDPFTENLC